MTVTPTRPLLVTDLLVAGHWLNRTASGRTLEVHDPATGDLLATLPDAGVEETRAAVDTAEAVRHDWAATTALERAGLLRDAAARMHKEAEELATIITLEQGKPLAESRGEIAYAASFLDWFAEEARRVIGEIVPAPARDKRTLVMRRPVGVTAAITPWNFPAAMITRKLGAAFAAGCPMVIKPSELTPLTALAIAAILVEVGVPDGVLSVVVGSDPARIGGALMDDTRVRKVSFTGSRAVGQLLVRQSAPTLTRLSLELGGHAPFLVFEDADLQAAIAGAVASKMRNMGQTCVCANRFYVHENVAPAFQEALAAELEAMPVGSGLDPSVRIGPLIDADAVTKVEAHVEDALARGATAVLRGGRMDDRPGNFYRPVVLAGVDEEMLVTREETFGPVAPIMTFRSDDEVVARANDTEFGLAAYAYTRDLGRALRLADRLEYGVLGINDGMPSTAEGPFGGVKGSGYGREGGTVGIDEYLDAVYVSIGGIDS